MTLDIGTPCQISWVTKDLDAMEDTLTRQLGAKKWVRMPQVEVDPATCTYRGNPIGFLVDASLSYIGDMQLEIVAPISGDDNLYEEFLRTSGPGIHHVCFEVDNVEEAVKSATARGLEALQQGVVPGAVEYAYVGSSASNSSCVEFAKFTPEIYAFFEFVKSEQK
ncbi:VOC family protein [Nocardia sp. NPDC055029]